MSDSRRPSNAPRFALIVCVFLASSARVHAQPQDVPEVDAEVDAEVEVGVALPRDEALFQQGVEALRLVQFEAASTYFRQSLDARPQAKAACNLALTFDRWGGHEAEARDAYIRCAELDESGRFRNHALARAAALRDVLAQRPVQRDPEPDPPVEGQLDPPIERQARHEIVPLPVRVEPVVSPRALLWAGIALTVAGGAVLASAAAPTTSSAADSKRILIEYPDRRIDPTDTEFLQLREEFNRKRRVATGLYIAGGGVALMGITFIVVDVIRHRRHLPASAPSVRTAIVPTEGGAMAVGQFEF